MTRVFVSDHAIIKACNTPGGSGNVYEYMDGFAQAIWDKAVELAPVNNPGDAMHRGGVVGTYKASFHWDRIGSNGHNLYRTVYNTADHARIVEAGRPDTRWGIVRFSGRRGEKVKKKEDAGRWERYSVARFGRILSTKGTPARRGQHVLREAAIFARATYKAHELSFRALRPR